MAEEQLDVKALAGMLRELLKDRPRPPEDLDGFTVMHTGMANDLLEALDPPSRNIANSREIKLFLHCRRCIRETLQPNVEVGWTGQGVQVWCKNHDCNIVHIDFEGRVHPANEGASLVIH